MKENIDLSYLPPSDSGIKLVWSWQELLDSSFSPSINCILYPRRLLGDFNALAKIGWQACEEYSDLLKLKRDVTRVKKLTSFFPAYKYLCDQYGPMGEGKWPEGVEEACKTLIKDENFLRNRGFVNSVRFVKEYDYTSADSAGAAFFHADRMGWEFGRVAMRYTDPAMEFVRNQDTVLPEDTNRAMLKEGAQVFSLKAGDVCRIATRFSLNTEPFIHRGPESSQPGLALICHLKSEEPEDWPPKPSGPEK